MNLDELNSVGRRVGGVVACALVGQPIDFVLIVVEREEKIMSTWSSGDPQLIRDACETALTSIDRGGP